MELLYGAREVLFNLLHEPIAFLDRVLELLIVGVDVRVRDDLHVEVDDPQDREDLFEPAIEFLA